MADLIPPGASADASAIDAWLAADGPSSGPEAPQDTGTPPASVEAAGTSPEPVAATVDASTLAEPEIASTEVASAIVEQAPATRDAFGIAEPITAAVAELSLADLMDLPDTFGLTQSSAVPDGVPQAAARSTPDDHAVEEPTAAFSSPDSLIQPIAAPPQSDCWTEPAAALADTVATIAESTVDPALLPQLATAPSSVPAPPFEQTPEAAEPAERVAGSLLEAVAALDERTAAAAPVADALARVPVAATDQERYVLFTIAGAQYAVPENCVTELDRVPKITFVPNVPGWIRGVTNRRGDILSVVDTRVLLGLDRTDLQSGRMLVVRLVDDSCSLGLLVDDVQQIASVPLGGVRQPGSALEGPLAPFFTGLFDFDERAVAVLDMDRLLRSPTIRQFDEPTEGTVQG